MRARINGVELHYEVTGEGPTVALTHGLGGCGDDWAPIVPGLAHDFRVLTWDVRGMGASEKNPAVEYSVAQFASDLAGLLDHIGAERAFLMGTSMGGTITQRFLLDFPGRALAAVICSTSSQVSARARDAWLAQADLIEREGTAAWVRRGRAPHMTEDWLNEHPEALAEEARRTEQNRDAAVFAQATRAVADYSYTEELTSLTVPALVLVGAEDTSTPPGGSVIIARAIPGARLHILDGLGHALYREAPEKVLSLVVPFLTGVAQTAAVA
ncbi:MAG: alpha/beta fold hydrolase [Dehalococcoidia bacterium]